MTAKEELKKLDTFSVALVYKRRDALNELVKTVEHGKYIGEHLEQLIPAISPAYASRLSVDVVLIEQSLYALLGRKSNGFPSLKDCMKANWVLAANVDVLQSGRPVTPFTQVHWPEWVPLSLLTQSKDYTRAGEPGFWYKFLAIGGSPATETFDLFVRNKGGWWFAHTNMFGLSRKVYKKIPGPQAYVGMRTWAYLDPGCKFGPFDRSEVTATFAEFNRELLRSRDEPCPYGKSNDCYECPVGRESCARSVHDGNYVLRHCASCHGMNWYKDGETELDDTVCIPCREKARITRKFMSLKGRNKNASSG